MYWGSRNDNLSWVRQPDKSQAHEVVSPEEMTQKREVGSASYGKAAILKGGGGGRGR